MRSLSKPEKTYDLDYGDMTFTHYTLLSLCLDPGKTLTMTLGPDLHPPYITKYLSRPREDPGLDHGLWGQPGLGAQHCSPLTTFISSDNLTSATLELFTRNGVWKSYQPHRTLGTRNERMRVTLCLVPRSAPEVPATVPQSPAV